MGNFFIHNGKFVKAGTPVVAADNRGLRYGDGLFETMKLLNGTLLHADEHFARLWQGMQVLGFDIPRRFSPDMLEEQLKALAARNGLANARLRLMVYRSEGGLYDAKNHTPNYIAEATPLPEGCGSWNSNGLVLGVYEDALKVCDITAGLKHNNYLPYVLAAQHARQQKWNDALLLNVHGNICDSTIANVFIIKNELVITPPLSEGCVAGVMRRHVLQLLRNAGMPVQEQAIQPAALYGADEVFLTNAIYNLRWVQRAGEAEYGNALTQKIYSLLQPTITPAVC